MEMTLKFEELNCNEMYAIEGGVSAYDVGYQVGKYIGIFVTGVFFCCL